VIATRDARRVAMSSAVAADSIGKKKSRARTIAFDASSNLNPKSGRA
jgi:hypothetical protein